MKNVGVSPEMVVEKLMGQIEEEKWIEERGGNMKGVDIIESEKENEELK